MIISFYWLFLLSNVFVENKKIDFFIKKNTSFHGMMEDLAPNLKSKISFMIASKFKKYDKNIKTGRYVIERSMNNNQLINNLRINNIPIKVTFNNLERIENLASVVSKQIEADSLSLINQLLSEEFLIDNGFNANTALSMYVPNSYELFWDISSGRLSKKNV